MGKNYVENSDLFREIMASKAQGQLTNSAVKMLELMAHRISRGGNWKSAELRRDCIAHAISVVAHKWQQYDPNESTNAFAYYTRMIINGLTEGLKENSHKIGTTHISFDALTNGGENA